MSKSALRTGLVQQEQVTVDRSQRTKRPSLPEWFKIRPPTTSAFTRIKGELATTGLKTVCEEAHCPNLSECWSGGTATYMLLGDTCTRGCQFCAVKTGNPHQEIDELEPWKLAQTIKKSGLDYVVLTMVARDDLEDGGAAHLAKCIRAIHQTTPQVLVEILISDLRGKESSLAIVLESRPVVLAHNIETIDRLTKFVRDGRASYKQTLQVLANAKKLVTENASLKKIYTKSSIMLGLGETEEEVIQTMKDLRSVGTDMLTLGQYLQPSSKHIELKEYVHPDQFARLEKIGLDLGFIYVASGPLVRSSYKAGELFVKSQITHQR
ncbi:MAG: lipoyl synthase [Candidatus Gracilibacteria bacterium]